MATRGPTELICTVWVATFWLALIGWLGLLLLGIGAAR